MNMYMHALGKHHQHIPLTTKLIALYAFWLIAG